ncbi:MAG: hypothetical protein ABJA70_16555 [Chryseolinea sp.]
MRYILIPLLFVISINLNGQTADSVGRIYISHDQGTSWSRSDVGFPNEDVVNTWIIKDNQIFAGTDSHGVMISSDEGKSWSKSRKGLPHSARVTTLLANNEAIFAGTFQHGVFKSLDNGSSWQQFNSGINNLTIRKFHDNGIDIYAGTNDGVYVLSKANDKWIKIGGDYQVNDFASDHEFIYVATHLGVFRTPDGGSNWQKVYRNGAAFKIAIEAHQICLLDYSGNVQYANTKQLVWFKDETYMPVRHSYRLTPTSQKILIPATGIHNILLTTPANGLPANAPFNNLLQTPFGVFASSVTMKGC